MIEFTCGNCGKKVRTSDEYAGKKGKCPGCGQVVTIPAAEQTPGAPGAAAPPPPSPTAAPPTPASSPPEPRQPQPSDAAAQPSGGAAPPPLPSAPAQGPPPAAPAAGGPARSSGLATAALIIGIAVLVFLILSIALRLPALFGGPPQSHLPQQTSDRAPKAGPPPRPSKAGGAAFYFVGGCLGFVAAATGVVLGIVAAVKIHKSRGLLKGIGRAVTGICLCGATIILSGVAGMIMALLPAAALVKRGHAAAKAMTNLRRLAMVAEVYVDENGRLPPADKFPQELERLDPGVPRLLRDPADPDGGRLFAMNHWLSNVSIDSIPEPSRTVLFFECKRGFPCAGDRRNLPAEPRYPGGYVISFVDGSVRRVPPGQVDSLIWRPPVPKDEEEPVEPPADDY